MLERLTANNVAIPAYVQGMMLLNAIPDDWDHVAAYYVQTTHLSLFLWDILMGLVSNLVEEWRVDVKST